MKVWNTARVLSQKDVKIICEKAYRILSEVGVQVENQKIRDMLQEHGAKIERQRVYFSEAFVQDFLSQSQPPEEADPGSVDEYGTPLSLEGTQYGTGAYVKNYMPIGTTTIEPYKLSTVIDATRLADYLPNIDFITGSMGVPSDVPELLAPLYMRLVSWKYAAKTRSGCEEVWDTRLCPYIVEMGEVMKDNEGGKLSDYANAHVELISPLRFGKEEAKQFVYFWERDLPVRVGSMLSAGGSAPATLAGALALNLAENIFINILSKIFYDRKVLQFRSWVSVLDMKKVMYPYGRPELALMHLTMGQLANFYHATFSAVFSADAKVPSSEAGLQKALAAICGIMAGARSLIAPGFLSVDEILSPVQLVIDNEFIGALKRLSKGFQVDEDKVAFDLIKKVGPGGLFTGTEHTVKYYRKEHWQPEIFSREMYCSWMSGDRKTDVERATDICKQILKEYHPVETKKETEEKLKKVIQKAKQKLLE
jgi:trimethylamine--corrinoid protein Co-methyltransferase